MSEQTPKVGSRLRTRLVLGTAAAALIVGGFAGEAVIGSRSPAYADAVRVQSAAPQLPNFADLVDKVKPAVVSVRVKSEVADASDEDSGNGNGFSMPNPGQFPPGSPMERFFKQFQDQQNGMGGNKRPQMHKAVGLGSGFFISDDGYVVTNNHVVDGSTDFTVTDSAGKEYTARLIGTDPKTDLALLKVDDTKQKFTYVEFAPGDVRVGEWVVAVGNPFGLGGTVTAGIVSALGRDIGAGTYDDFIQIDASVNKGNSGGPTFNMNGQVIGINTAIYSPSGGSVGIAFDIPAATAQRVIGDLKDHGEVVRGWLGVQIQPITRDIADSLNMADAKGALVAEPQEGSPATLAGIKSGDAIVSVDSKTVEDARNLSQIIAGYAPGTTVKLGIVRSGKSQTVEVKLGKLPGEDKMASADQPAKPASVADLGLALTASPDDKGVVVSEVDPDGAAAEQGIQPGDVILAVGGSEVSRPGDVEREVVDAKKAGMKAVLVRIKSGDHTRFVALPFGKA
ncbi:MAG TPA: Do family serine endopeptidase [Kaistia sp.]|nr:Do family serine endopeptidase [Kaistia sp.]